MGVYLFNFLLIIVIGKLIDKYNIYTVGKIIIISMWAIIIGFQFNVGSDYFSYLEIFESKEINQHFYSKGEYLFYYFVYFYQKIFKNGQYGFVIISIIQSIIFFKVMEKAKIKKRCIFLILFMCACTLFHNQMNMVRQGITIYLYTLSIIYFVFHEKIKSFFMFIIEIFIHKSSFFNFILYVFCFCNLKITSKRFIKSVVLIIIILVLPLNQVVVLLLNKTSYSYYSQITIFLEELPLKNIASKIIYVPIYYIAIKNKEKIKLNGEEEKIFYIGIISYLIKLVLLKNTLLYRLGEYYTILMLFPIYYLLESNSYSKMKKISIYLYLVLPYIYKILTFYEYKSYFFEK